MSGLLHRTLVCLYLLLRIIIGVVIVIDHLAIQFGRLKDDARIEPLEIERVVLENSIKTLLSLKLFSCYRLILPAHCNRLVVYVQSTTNSNQSKR